MDIETDIDIFKQKYLESIFPQSIRYNGRLAINRVESWLI